MLPSTLLIQTLLVAAALANASSLARAPKIASPQVELRSSTSTVTTTISEADDPSHVLSDVLAGIALFSNNVSPLGLFSYARGLTVIPGIQGTYNLVSTHVHLPEIRPPDNTSITAAYTWSGIDGIGCGVAALQAGLRLVAAEGFAAYDGAHRRIFDSFSG